MAAMFPGQFGHFAGNPAPSPAVTQLEQAQPIVPAVNQQTTQVAAPGPAEEAAPAEQAAPGEVEAPAEDEAPAEEAAPAAEEATKDVEIIENPQTIFTELEQASIRIVKANHKVSIIALLHDTDNACIADKLGCAQRHLRKSLVHSEEAGILGKGAWGNASFRPGLPLFRMHRVSLFSRWFLQVHGQPDVGLRRNGGSAEGPYRVFQIASLRVQLFNPEGPRLLGDALIAVESASPVPQTRRSWE